MKAKAELERARTPAAKQELRSKILREAVHLFAAEGYDAFTMRKLAERIGYTATTIYAYFENKDDLMYAVITSGYDTLRDYLAVPSREPLTRMAAVGRAYLDFAFENPELYKLMFMLRPPALFDLTQEKVAARLETLFTVATTAGSLPQLAHLSEADLKRVAELFWAELHGIASLAIQIPLFDEKWARANLEFLIARLTPVLTVVGASKSTAGGRRRR